MEQLTDQQVFDAVATHLLTQNERSVGKSTCLYRDGISKSGKQLKCAIGCLIPDEAYTPSIEGKSVALLPDSVIAAAGLAQAEQELLVILQILHDDMAIIDWKYELREIAEKFELSPAILDRF